MSTRFGNHRRVAATVGRLTNVLWLCGVLLAATLLAACGGPEEDLAPPYDAPSPRHLQTADDLSTEAVREAREEPTAKPVAPPTAGLPSNLLATAKPLAMTMQATPVAAPPVGYGGAPGQPMEGPNEPAEPWRDQEGQFNTESYDEIADNPFLDPLTNPLSTFSVDVDTAAYSVVRRHLLQQNGLPPKGAVRIEELVNYFDYDYAPPAEGQPFAVHVDLAECPWQEEHELLRIGLKGREIPLDDRPDSNLVFLLDVSGSMSDLNKLPLVKESMRLLVGQLDSRDRVAIVVYAGSSGLVLPSTAGDDAERILGAIDRLESGGSTNAGSGIQLAYDVATENFIEGGVNRVILATDGDFNVGITNQSDLTDLIEDKAASGVYLTVLGFGMGNYKDSTLENLADTGNGNYGYIDNLNEGRKVLVEEMAGTLITIAKDVKIQVEFNPAEVAAYRLIGYEDRLLAAEDFVDDTKDAGEIGAGHTVTALYEIVPGGVPSEAGTTDPLKYQEPGNLSDAALGGELLTVKLRYKPPEGSESRLMELPFAAASTPLSQAAGDFKLAAAVAAFGMLLRESEHAGDADYPQVLELARSGIGADESGRRAEFVTLVEAAERLAPESAAD